MPVKGWKRRFDEPIDLPEGGRIATLQEAIAYLANSIPVTEHSMKEVQAAAHCITDAAENDGPMLFARIGMMQAIYRHQPRTFDLTRKRPAAGKAEAETGTVISDAVMTQVKSRATPEGMTRRWPFCC
jgi:hypothetical protein